MTREVLSQNKLSRLSILQVVVMMKIKENEHELLIFQVRFQVLTAARRNMAVFYDVAPCSLVDV
jgi:hypothetical protein